MNSQDSLEKPSDSNTPSSDIHENTDNNASIELKMVNEGAGASECVESVTLPEETTETASLAESKITRKSKRKSCPKLKISKTKETVDPTDMKSWYVSERKPSTDSTESAENVAKQNESVIVNDLERSSDSCKISSSVLESKKVSDTGQSSDLLEIPPLDSKSEETSVVEESHLPEISSTVTESENQLTSNSLAETINNSAPNDSSISDQNSVDVASNESPINETLDTPTVECTDSIVTGSSVVDDASNNETIPINPVDTEMTLENTDNSATEINDASVPFSVESNSCAVEMPNVVGENLAPNDVEKDPGKCSEELSQPPVAIKEEPIDIEEEPPVQYPDANAVNIKVEDEISTCESLTTPPVKKRRGRPSRSSNNKIAKAEVSIPVSSESVPEPITPASAPKSKEKKGNSKITNYFNKQSAMPAPLPSTSLPPKKTVSLSPTRSRKKKYCPDSVIVPFSMGWMRELVHRAATESKVGKKMSDIYYFSPEGTKLRSMIEIGNYLSRQKESKLSLVNFTFAKECVFREPFEIERSAKQKSIISTPAATLKKETPTLSVKKKTPSSTPLKKTLVSKIANKRTPLLPKTSTPILTIRNVNQGNKVRKKFTCILDEANSIADAADSRPRRNTRNVSFGEVLSAKETELSAGQLLTSFETKDDANSETTNTDGVQPRNISKQNLTENKKTKMLSTTQNRAKLKSVLPKNVESSLYQPCTPRCPVAKFQVPSIQCSMCLCLFHQNCVARVRKGLNFACRSCTTAKLQLYETLRNPKVSATASESCEENYNSDIPADMDTSFLSPEINIRTQHTRAELYDSSISSISSSGDETFSASSYLSENPNSASRPVPILPNSVPFSNSPQLLSHLLHPSLNSNVRMRPIAPRSSVNFTRSTLIINRNGNNYLPRNFIRVGMRLPAVGKSLTLPNSVVIQHLPEGRMLIRRGTVTTAPPSINPISALENLSQAVGPRENWPSVSGQTIENNSTNKVPTRTYGKSTDTCVGSVVNKFGNVPQRMELSDPSTSNHETSALHKGNEVNSSELSNLPSWNMSRFLTSFECLTLIFKKLNTCDLLRVGQVCKSWKHLATQSSLWEKVYFSNLTITNWKNCCCFMKKVGTKYIDFSGVIHPDPEVPFDELEINLTLLSEVQEVIFDQIPSSLLKAVTYDMPQLRRLECHFVTDAVTEPEIWSSTCELELSSLRCLGRLVKLKIRSGGELTLNHGNEYLMPYLPNLRHVSLTGFNFCSHYNLESISQQKELISLELGDCSGVEPGIYALLGCLPNLKSLRLENGGSMNDVKLSEALKQMKGLEVLELMNFKIPTSLVDVFKNFHQLIHLNIWPDTTTKGPLINRNLLQCMSNCQDLSYVCWGLIAEGEFAPETLEIKSSIDEDKTDELTFEELFNKLVGLFPECRVEVKCVPRDSWREFCSTRR